MPVLVISRLIGRGRRGESSARPV